MDTDRLRAGVELDHHGAPRAYHIRQALPGDCFLYFPRGEASLGDGNGPYIWTRVPRETAWGRRQVLHVFEPEHPGQTWEAVKKSSLCCGSPRLARLPALRKVKNRGM